MSVYDYHIFDDELIVTKFHSGCAIINPTTGSGVTLLSSELHSGYTKSIVYDGEDQLDPEDLFQFVISNINETYVDMFKRLNIANVYSNGEFMHGIYFESMNCLAFPEYNRIVEVKKETSYPPSYCIVIGNCEYYVLKSQLKKAESILKHNSIEYRVVEL